MSLRKKGNLSYLNILLSIVSVTTIVAAFFVTKDNYNLMREDMEIRNRPILSLEDWHIELTQGSYVGKDNCKFAWETKNYGQTPATNVSLELTFFTINNSELYSRTIYRNKYLVPSQLISHESENIDYKFEVPSSLGLWSRYKNRTLRMKITLRYNSIRVKEKMYIYEISGIMQDDGWKTSSESWDERKRHEKTIMIEVPSPEWGEKASTHVLDTSLLGYYKLHDRISKIIADFFSGKTFHVLNWDFAITVRSNLEEPQEKQRFSLVSPSLAKKKYGQK